MPRVFAAGSIRTAGLGAFCYSGRALAGGGVSCTGCWPRSATSGLCLISVRRLDTGQAGNEAQWSGLASAAAEVRQPTVMSGRRTPATATTTRWPATSAARTEPGSRPGHPSGVPAALPSSATTAPSAPELAARTGLL